MMKYAPKLVELVLYEPDRMVYSSDYFLISLMFFIFVINLCKHFIFIEFFSFCNVSFMGRIR